MTAAEVKKLRAGLGMTQMQLANVIGVARNSVNRWEMGIQAVSPQTERALTLLRMSLRLNEWVRLKKKLDEVPARTKGQIVGPDVRSEKLTYLVVFSRYGLRACPDDTLVSTRGSLARSCGRGGRGDRPSQVVGGGVVRVSLDQKGLSC